MTKCYICGNEIKEKSVEHIILNCIGGKLKSNKLLCRKCNSDFGSEIDRHLCEEMKVISNLLNIKREKGNPPKIEGIGSDGEEYSIDPGLKPHLKAPVKRTSNGYIISADIDHFTSLLKNMAKKNPNIDYEEILNNSKEGRNFIDKMHINFSFDDENKTLRAICKMAVNYYLHTNGTKEYIQHLIPYIIGTEDRECVWFYCAAKDEIYYPKEKQEVLHSIILNGNNEEKVLYAYIELFSTFGFIVLLNSNYNGINFSESYFFNVQTRKEEIKSIKTPKSQIDLEELSKKPFSTNNFETSLNELFYNITVEHFKCVVADLVSELFSEWSHRHNDQVISDNEIIELVNEFGSELTPLICHLQKNCSSNEIAIFMELFSEAVTAAVQVLKGNSSTK